MNSDKRLLAAVGLSFLILLLYPLYLKWVSPTPASAPGIIGSQTAENAGGNLKATSPAEMIQPPPELEENLHPFSHRHFNVEFSNRGGAITKLELKNWGKRQRSETLIERAQDGSGAFLTSLSNQGIDFGTRIFSLQGLNEQSGEVQFSTEEPGKWRLLKRYRFSETTPAISLEVEIKNLDTEKQLASLEVTTQFGSDSKQRDNRFPQ